MTDNVIDFRTGAKGVVKETPTGPVADDILTEAMGKYDDVILIGIKAERAQCISTMTLDQAVYEVSRALHRLHCYIDRS